MRKFIYSGGIILLAGQELPCSSGRSLQGNSCSSGTPVPLLIYFLFFGLVLGRYDWHRR
jgi:hypothetical protein